jgi:CDP-glucose 4,6-dehydratase
MCKHWKSPKIEYESDQVPEATALALDSTLARSLLNWISPWDTNRAVAETAAWYRDYHKEPQRAKELTFNQMLSWREGISI